MGGSLAGVQGLTDTPVHVPGLAASALQTLWPLRFVSVVQGSARLLNRGAASSRSLCRESPVVSSCPVFVQGQGRQRAHGALLALLYWDLPGSPTVAQVFAALLCMRQNPTPYCPVSLPNMAGSLSCGLSTGDFMCCYGPPVASVFSGFGNEFQYRHPLESFPALVTSWLLLAWVRRHPDDRG